jgi:NADH dehydrogenase
METAVKEKKIIIVGGGFAGISAALELETKHLPNTKIILISDRPHFEFHASLYRVLTGHSPLEVCVPLDVIFKGTKVEVIQDKITEIDVTKNELKGGPDMVYHYDYLVLAVGSEINFYGIEGLDRYSFNINSITETLRLKRHLHEIFTQCETLSKEEKKCSAHIVIVGGGATGCEAAGELATYSKELAKRHNLNPKIVKVDLIHRGDRILSFLPKTVTDIISKRLTDLGVNIILNKNLVKEDIETVYFPDVQMKTKTLVWTAGVKLNPLFASVKEFSFDEKGRVKVDEHLSAYKNVYVVGDGAATKYSGMARPAIHSGEYAAQVIANNCSNKPTPAFVDKPSPYILPIAQGWAITNVLGPVVSGRLGWLVKRVRDFIYFMSILPLPQAWVAYNADSQLTESCPLCCQNPNQ